MVSLIKWKADRHGPYDTAMCVQWLNSRASMLEKWHKVAAHLNMKNGGPGSEPRFKGPR